MIPNKENGPEFIDDWNRMISAVAEFSEKWQLLPPDMVFNPRVHFVMNALAQRPILGTLIHAGVRVRFGTFVQRTVLREG